MQEREHNSKVQLTSKIKYAVTVLTFFFVMVMNIGCSENKKGNPTENVSATPSLSPTKSITPTSTPTPDNTPTIMPTSTATPIPTPNPSKRPITVTEMWTEEFLNTTFFDADKPIADQMNDRKKYLLTFDGCLSESEADVLVRWINLNATNETMMQENYDLLAEIAKKVLGYNQSHSDNMIPFSLLGIELSEDDKMVYNNLQCICLEMTNNLPKDATIDECYEYKDANFFTKLSYGSVLSVSTKDEERKSSKYVNLKSLDMGCRVLTCLYSIEVLRPYKNTDMRVRRTCITEYLEQEWNAIKTGKNP